MVTHVSDWAVDDDAARGLTATVVEYDDAVECVIYPTDVGPEESVTTWLAARDDGFVELVEMR